MEPSRTSTAAPFATRNATTAGWSLPRLPGAVLTRSPKTSVEAVAVPAQVAPDGREVAGGTPRGRCRRLSARRNETEMTMFFSFFFPLIFLISLSYKSAKSATIEIPLNQLET